VSGAPAEIDIVATDDASDVFQDVSSNFSDMSNEVSEASDTMSSDVSDSMQQTASSVSTMTTTVQADTSQMQDSFNEAGSTVQVSMNQITTSAGEASDATDASSQSFSQNAMQMNSAAMSGAMLYMGLNNIENAQVQLARANLVEEKAANDVTLAQQAYNKAVAEYGVNSLQAEDAANKLNLAIQTQQVDQERVAESQRSYNSTLLMSALTVIPAFVNIIGLASNATQVWTGIQAAFDAVMDANPIILVALAVVGLTAGIIWAYENCAPFRDVINDIGHIIGGSVLSAFDALKTAGDALWNALNWAYNNILLPVANFFKEVLVADLNVALAPVKAFETAINAVANAVKPLSSVIDGLGSALSHLCFAHAAPAAEEFNKQITQSLALSDQLAHKTNTLGSSLQALSSNIKIGGGAGTSNVNISSPNITIGSVIGTASLRQTRDAVSKGICDAMYKKGLMNKVL
jgi:F0F1-type ATP synthase assembly protein I